MLLYGTVRNTLYKVWQTETGSQDLLPWTFERDIAIKYASMASMKGQLALGINLCWEATTAMAATVRSYHICSRRGKAFTTGPGSILP